MTLSLNYEAVHGYISIEQLMKHGTSRKLTDHICPPKCFENKMHAIILYFYRNLLFHILKDAVLSVTKHLKCFR